MTQNVCMCGKICAHIFTNQLQYYKNIAETHMGSGKRVILEVPLISILSPSKNDMSIKITILSKFNNNQSQL
jgi:hypothetical protein